MDKFTTLTGVAAPLNMVNVDTDMIIPKQFLKTIKRTGLKEGLFSELRWDVDGTPKDFVLDRAPYQDSKILVAGDNFGCGSSREHAPWALLDFGIRCVIAPSFADIFYNNCFKNGLLPVSLTEEQVEDLFRRVSSHSGYQLTVDLAARTLRDDDGLELAFEVDPARHERLLKGLDDIAITLSHADKIDAYERAHGITG